MCSVNEDVEDLLTKDPSSLNFEVCKKCMETKPNVVRGIDPLCSGCFLAYCTHKFRSTIGKAHKMKPGEVVLVCFNGDAESMALLHMIGEGLRETSHKRILFKPVLLYLHDSSSAVDTEYLTRTLNIMILSQLPCFISTMEMAFNTSVKQIKFCLEIKVVEEGLSFLNQHISTNLLTMLNDLGSETSREDILEHIRTTLINKIAEAICCDKVFSSDSSSKLAVKLLSSVALGRGSQIPDFMSFVDSRFKISILRPLREFVAKEIAFYNHFHNSEAVMQNSLSSKAPQQESIQKMTESFITNLQNDFQSTVPTIFRTGDKICSSLTQNIDENNYCSFCQSLTDTAVHLDGASAIGALLFSEKLNQPSAKAQENCNEYCSCKSAQKTTKEILTCQLCYGCHWLIKDMTTTDSLPFEIIGNVKKSIIRKQMKNQIEEFLLPEIK